MAEAAGFISLGIEKSTKEYALERGQYLRIITGTQHSSAPDLARGFAERIAGALRLSVTFRFRTASAELDNRAVEDLRRLASYVRQNPEVQRRLLLLGFADQRGDFHENRALSSRRARQIADALASLGVNIGPANTQGFGVVAPVACNDSDLALEKNRRVEVWLRQ